MRFLIFLPPFVTRGHVAPPHLTSRADVTPPAFLLSSAKLNIFASLYKRHPNSINKLWHWTCRSTSYRGKMTTEIPKPEKTASEIKLSEMRRGSQHLAGKLKDCVPRFNGRGDVETWLTQLEAAAKTIGLSDEEYANGALLLLDGPAFAAVARLSDEARCSVKQVRTCLRKAFAKPRFTAFEEFMQRNWRLGETACVYELELRNLATQAKMENDAVI